MGKVLALVGVVLALSCACRNSARKSLVGRLSLVALGESARAERRRQRGLTLGRLPRRRDRRLERVDGPRSEQDLGRNESRELWSDRAAGSKSAMARMVRRAGSASRRSGSRRAATSPRRRPSSTTRTSTRRRTTRQHGDAWSRARRSRTTSGSITRTRTSTIRTWARAWTTPATRSGHRRTSTRISTTSTSSSRSTPTSTAQEGRRQAVPRQEVPERSRRRSVALAGQQGERRRVRRPPAERWPPPHARVLGARLDRIRTAETRRAGVCRPFDVLDQGRDPESRRSA